ncbi:MAG: hypothetical protein ACWA6U_17900 [Breznakibacter sp.]
MMQILKMFRQFLGRMMRGFRFYYSINWIKTVYFNFKMLPFSQAQRLPIVFYGKVKLISLKGNVIIQGPLKFGMVGFGQKYEIVSVSKRNAQLTLDGTFVVKGLVQFGIDYCVYIGTGSILEMGHLSSLGGSGKILCTNKVVFGCFSRVGFESQIIDTNFHNMYDTKNGIVGLITEPICLGDYNYIGNRVSIMKSTQTPRFCTVASNSVLSKDYRSFGENVLIGGIPARLIRDNIRRDWISEDLELFLDARNY